MERYKSNLKPVTKWVGGKRQLLSELLKYVPQSYNEYYEPFIGGGALFFRLAPHHAVINDINTDLINMYRVIKENPMKFIEILKFHEKKNSKEYYLKVREWDRDNTISKLTDIEKAARIMYMLKVDFNGLYRVNKNNQFNVPYGKYTDPKIVDEPTILNASKYLTDSDVKIFNDDFEQITQDVERGDFVYFDPPYIPLNATSDFTAYTKNGFNLDDQLRLRDLFFKLANKGAYVMLSNSDTLTTRELYKEGNVHSVRAIRAINSNAKKRGKVGELIITNY